MLPWQHCPKHGVRSTFGKEWPRAERLFLFPRREFLGHRGSRLLSLRAKLSPPPFAGLGGADHWHFPGGALGASVRPPQFGGCFFCFFHSGYRALIRINACTVAILAPGTSWAVAVTQAYYFPYESE